MNDTAEVSRQPHHRNSFLKEPPFRESLQTMLNAGREDFPEAAFSKKLDRALQINWDEKYLEYWLPGYECLADGYVYGANPWSFTKLFVNRVTAAGAGFAEQLAALCFVADPKIQQRRAELIEQRRADLAPGDTAGERFLESQSVEVPVALGLCERDQRLYRKLIDGLKGCLDKGSIDHAEASKLCGNSANYLLRFHQAARSALQEF